WTPGGAQRTRDLNPPAHPVCDLRRVGYARASLAGGGLGRHPRIRALAAHGTALRAFVWGWFERDRRLARQRCLDALSETTPKHKFQRQLSAARREPFAC